MQNLLVRRVLPVIAWISAWTSARAAEDPAGALWQRPYAVGEEVLALWHFDEPAPTADALGRSALALRGQSRFVPAGKFGGALECFASDAANDKAQGAAARSLAALTPQGAFTVEMWAKAKPELATSKTAFLLDKKYFHYPKELPQANWDYCLYLTAAPKGEFVLNASLGFGTGSDWFRSSPVAFPAGQWRHVAFAYDGGGGVRFFVDGLCVGRGRSKGRGPVVAGTHALVVGDRVGSTHSGFPGFIDEVRISAGVPADFAGALALALGTGRTVFRRGEADAKLAFSVVNDTGVALDSLSGRVTLAGRDVPVAGGALAPGEALPVQVPFDTWLRPDTYEAAVHVEGRDAGGRARVPSGRDRGNRHRPPAAAAPDAGADVGRRRHRAPEGDRLHPRSAASRGLRDDLAGWRRPRRVRRPGRGDGAPARPLSGQRPRRGRLPLPRTLGRDEQGSGAVPPDRRAGEPHARHNTSAGHPDVQRFAYATGAAVARTFGQFPALSASLIHSEIRDGTAISHHDFELAQCREALGFDLPREATSKGGVDYRAIAGFPQDRVIDDDDPLLRFYRWFWKEGDGWNPLHTQVHKGLKSTGREDIWTFFDPAVRVPSIWGSGGGVDIVSQWTYSYPDPIKVGQAADELFAMADGTPGQRVMKMTQIIWYRSQTAPEGPKSGAAEWETRIPDAKFITISPDHLREAFWSMLSRPVRGIMYHGWGSLVEATHGGYRYTNPETREVLAELIRDVVSPLGPTLLQVPDRPADVALLQSFSSQMFAGRGSYGWSGSWDADVHLILQWAGLQPRILYEEHILRDGLAPYKVLVMPHCDVLPRRVAEPHPRLPARRGPRRGRRDALPRHLAGHPAPFRPPGEAGRRGQAPDAREGPRAARRPRCLLRTLRRVGQSGGGHPRAHGRDGGLPLRDQRPAHLRRLRGPPWAGHGKGGSPPPQRSRSAGRARSTISCGTSASRRHRPEPASASGPNSAPGRGACSW